MERLTVNSFTDPAVVSGYEASGPCIPRAGMEFEGPVFCGIKLSREV
jgi:hypothetical protein